MRSENIDHEQCDKDNTSEYNSENSKQQQPHNKNDDSEQHGIEEEDKILYYETLESLPTEIKN